MQKVLTKGLMKLIGKNGGGRGPAERRLKSPNGNGAAAPVTAPPAFAVGTGRCGTHFLRDLMEKDPGIAAYHHRSIDSDAFARYCAWNRLPVDMSPFYDARRAWIDEVRSSGLLYFESEPYLSLSIVPLYERFGARFVFVVRRPEDVVNSLFVKGWYAEEFYKADADLAPGYAPGLRGNHVFGRIVPNGEEFRRWSRLTRVGKLAWMWNALNVRTLEQLREIPEEQSVTVKLEELGYDCYRRLHAFVGGRQPMSEQEFDRIRNSKPGKGRNHRTADVWSERERREFEAETEEGRRLLGYE